MKHWHELDLKNCFDRPAVGELVVLCLTPKSEQDVAANKKRYDVGRFVRDPLTGRKLWWCGTSGREDPASLKKHFKIIWYAIKDPDDFEYVK